MAFRVHLNSGIIVGHPGQTTYFVTFQHEKEKTIQLEEWEGIHRGVARAVEETVDGKAGDFPEEGNRDVTTCRISRKYSDDEADEKPTTLVEAMAVCNPLEPRFDRKEGRKRAFTKALGKLFGERYNNFNSLCVEGREVQANGGCKRIRTEFWGAFFESVIAPGFKNMEKQLIWWVKESAQHELKRDLKKRRKEERDAKAGA
jgi:hypothetical protein